jgi:hypothetical protein
MQEIWNSEDYRLGYCTAEQIGQEKPSSPQEVLSPTTLGPKDLIQDAFRAASKDGNFIRFLQENPRFHQQVLLQAIKDQTATPATVVIELGRDVPFIDWQNRLDYKGSIQQANVAWKKGISDVGLAGTLRDADKRG